MANVILLRSDSLLRIKLSKLYSFLKNCLKGFWEIFIIIIIYFYNYYIVPRLHYSARLMRFRSRGQSEEVSECFLPVHHGVTKVN